MIARISNGYDGLAVENDNTIKHDTLGVWVLKPFRWAQILLMDWLVNAKEINGIRLK